LDFSLKIGYIGSFKWKYVSTKGYFRLHIYLRASKTLMHNFFYIFGNWGKIFGHKTMQYNYSKKMFTKGPSRSG